MLTPATYQSEAATAIARHFRWHRCVLLLIPTRGRKTATALMAALLWNAVPRVLVITPQIEVVNQWLETQAKHFPNWKTQGMAADGRFETNREFTASTIQGVDDYQKRRALGSFDLVIFDEAHRSLSPTGHGIMQYYLNRGSKVLLLTATPDRHDGQPLSTYAEAVVEVKRETLERLGILVKPRTKRIKLDERHYTWANIVKEWQRHGENRQTIAFVDEKWQVDSLCHAFTHAGVKCGGITSDSTRTERRQTLDDFKTGRIQVLVNIRCVAEGVDVNNASCALIARRFGYKTPYLQAVGRVMGQWPMKRDGLILAMEAIEHIDTHVSFNIGVGRRIANTVKNNSRSSNSSLAKKLDDRLNQAAKQLFR